MKKHFTTIIALLLPLLLAAQSESFCSYKFIVNGDTLDINLDTIFTNSSVEVSFATTDSALLHNVWTKGADTISQSLTATTTVNPGEIIYITLEADKFGQNFVPNGDFAINQNLGNKTSYTYVANQSSQALWNEGTYAIGRNPHNYHSNFTNLDYGSNFMILNGAPKEYYGYVYVYKFPVEYGGYYDVSCEASGVNWENLPQLEMRIDDSFIDTVTLTHYNDGIFQFLGGTWYNENNLDSATFFITDNSQLRSGNDFGIDNIVIRQKCMVYDVIKLVVIDSTGWNRTDTIINGNDTTIVIFHNGDTNIVIHGDTIFCGDTITIGDTVIIHGDTIVNGDTINHSALNSIGIEQSLTLYPNPAKNVATINIIPLNEDAEISIYDINSRVAHRELLPKGSRNLNIDTHNLPNGTYVVNIKNNKININRQLIIAR